MRRRVHAAGGAVGAIRIGPRPLATLPAGTAGAAGGGGLAGRLWRYSEGVKLTVATRLLKEALGLRLVEEDEGKRGLSYNWVLWTREDAHWSSLTPLALTAPTRHAPCADRAAAWPASGSRRSTWRASRRASCTARGAVASAAGTTRSGSSHAGRPQESARAAPVAPPRHAPGGWRRGAARGAEPHAPRAAERHGICPGRLRVQGASAHMAPHPRRV